jgi:ElaB/YqjD/DUF883 family membrane-anchored ribosome-binding protein
MAEDVIGFKEPLNTWSTVKVGAGIGMTLGILDWN